MHNNMIIMTTRVLLTRIVTRRRIVIDHNVFFVVGTEHGLHHGQIWNSRVERLNVYSLVRNNNIIL